MVKIAQRATAGRNGAAPPEEDGEVGHDYVDEVTHELGYLAKSLLDVQKTRIRLHNRMTSADVPQQVAAVALVIVEDLERHEEQLKRELEATLQRHVMYEWLRPFRGLRNSLMARLIAIMRDPRRFPGQQCADGHYHPPLYGVGEPCPYEHYRDEELVPCGAPMLPARTGSGKRSFYHYLGLHVDENGRMPRRRKGVQSDWNGQARALILPPPKVGTGLADQILRMRTLRYRDIYDREKQKKLDGGCSLGHAHAIAKVFAVKRFLDDFLRAWKRAVADTPT
jgi:hypothetical protein